MSKDVKQMTNTQFFKKVMEYGSTGLEQPFMVEAVTRYIDEVIENQDEIIKDWGENSFINPKAWIATAEGLKKQFDEKYGS